MQHQSHATHMSPEMEQCIRNCQDCHHICIETTIHCLGMSGKHAEVAHIRLMQDCVQICQISADFMLRGSEFHARTCGVCADVCQHCAEDCERIGAEDAQMKACAEACRRCADSCHKMAGMAA